MIIVLLVLLSIVIYGEYWILLNYDADDNWTLVAIIALVIAGIAIATVVVWLLSFRA